MKYGKTLQENTIPEWEIYYIEYKLLKKTINRIVFQQLEKAEFFTSLENEIEKAVKFFERREEWCFSAAEDLQGQIAELVASLPSNSNDIDVPEGNQCQDDKDLYIKYLSAKKTAVGFLNEIKLLLKYVESQKTSVAKILKKFLKRTSTSYSVNEAESKKLRLKYLGDGSFCTDRLEGLNDMARSMLREVNLSKPSNHPSWEGRKVYTIGCFDLFHRGHVNLLLALRDFGNYVIVGVHDDHSYYQLKQKKPIESLETRMANVKRYVDQVYVIPSTKPTMYIKSMVSDQDVRNSKCCYVRGEDMLQFPGREYVETVMEVYFLPRSDGVSSTLVRSLYHSGEKAAKEAAFAPTDETGKPVV